MKWNNNKLGLTDGDIRWVKRFAFFPVYLDYPYDHSVWLETYYEMQRCYSKTYISLNLNTCNSYQWVVVKRVDKFSKYVR